MEDIIEKLDISLVEKDVYKEIAKAINVDIKRYLMTSSIDIATELGMNLEDVRNFLETKEIKEYMEKLKNDLIRTSASNLVLKGDKKGLDIIREVDKASDNSNFVVFFCDREIKDE